jgi:hypothetical protein
MPRDLHDSMTRYLKLLARERRRALDLEPLDVDGYRVPSRAELRELAAEVLAECERRERGH